MMHSLNDSSTLTNLFSIATTSSCSRSPLSSFSFGSLSSSFPYSTASYGSRTTSSACSDLGSHNVLSSASSGCTSIGSSPVPNEQNLIISPIYQNCTNQSESTLNATINADVTFLNNFVQNDLSTTRNQEQQFSTNPKLLSHSTPLPSFNTNNTYDHGKEKSSNRNQMPLPARKMAKPDSFKTVMCKGWLEMGGCGFGQNCRFAHGEEELRPSKIPVDNPKYKTKLCDKYTRTGVCPYGDRCLFIHPETGNSAAPANPYIHPDRMMQILKERAVSAMNMKRNQDDSSALKSVSSGTSPWFLKLSKHKAAGNHGEDVFLNLSSGHENKSLPEDTDRLRTLSDITNNALSALALSSTSNSLLISPKASPDSGTEIDADTGWSIATHIADPFDFAIESDNIARSLAIEFAKPF